MAKARSRLISGAADVELGVEVFARGFSFTRSFTHPCVGERVGPLWVIRDAVRKNAAAYRREEWVALGMPAREVDQLARRGTRGRFFVCAMLRAGEEDEPLRRDYRALGYRLMGTEPLMMHRLEQIPQVAGPLPIRRVDTPELAEAVKQAARRTQALPEHFGKNSALRLYAALEDGRAVGWVRSIAVDDAAWVSNMYVLPAQRRRGIGTSLLAAMLRDDRAHGVRRSVLLSSHTGALLYPHLGYEQIGMLYFYMPPKK